jgi:phenylpropionate dioxygenase-like ring-hydroxylating dioxygenase large terminal subunit
MLSVRAVLPANWKAAIAAFIELYHGPWTHPQTATYLGDERTATLELIGQHGRFIAPPGPTGQLVAPPDDDEYVEGFAASMGWFGFDPEEVKLPEGMNPDAYLVSLQRRAAERNGIDVSQLRDDELLHAQMYFLFPNLIVFPGPGNYGLYHRARPNGDDPTSCIFEINILRPLGGGETRPPDAPTMVVPAGTPWSEVFGEESFFATIFEQDCRNLAASQKGMASSSYPGLTLGLYQESLIRHFLEVLNGYLAEP